MLPPVRVVVEVLPSPHVLKMNFLRKKRKQLYLLLVCYKKQIIDVIKIFLQGNPIFRLFIDKFGFSFHPLAHKLPPSFCMGCPFFSYFLLALTPLERVLYSSNIKRHVMNIMTLQQNS